MSRPDIWDVLADSLFGSKFVSFQLPGHALQLSYGSADGGLDVCDEAKWTEYEGYEMGYLVDSLRDSPRDAGAQ